MLIFFLRHANAGERLSSLKRDAKRGLSEDGVAHCRALGRLLSTMDAHCELIFSSPLKRSAQSAVLVNNELGDEAELVLTTALAPGAKFEEFRELLRRNSRRSAIMIVGHNPMIAAWLSLLLTNGKSDKVVEMKKGSIARVDYTSKRTTLNWLITPKITRAASAEEPRDREHYTPPVVELKSLSTPKKPAAKKAAARSANKSSKR